MNHFRASHLFRLATVFVAMIGWFALSNRCALAQLASPASSVEAVLSCCGAESEQPCHPAKDAPPANECCQKPHLVMPSEAKVPTAVLTWLPLDAWAVCVVLVLPSAPVRVEAALSPPREASSFVELVLHRSLRSHAPPQLS